MANETQKKELEKLFQAQKAAELNYRMQPSEAAQAAYKTAHAAWWQLKLEIDPPKLGGRGCRAGRRQYAERQAARARRR